MPRSAGLALLCLLALSCDTSRPTAPPQPPSAPPRQPVPALETSALQRHVGFLADDEQQGRAPGTDDDARVQTYIEDAFGAAGLQPAFGTTFRQTFEVTDGVRLIKDGISRLDGPKGAIEHELLPFAKGTGATGPVEARLVFVGYGIVEQGGGAGDYAGIEEQVRDKIVVALHGGPSDNPHLPAGATRPQSKMISARDRGAVGFVLWDPTTRTPFPNHGSANDLQLPAVFVGAAGNRALQRALGVRKPGSEVVPDAPGIDRGATSKKPFALQSDVERIRLQTANVAAFLEGDGSSEKVVVVGAHHDHLGLGTSSSLAPGEHAIHNGADDNASGVAAVLELCGAMAALPAAQRPYNLMCMTFAAEEMGLLGSKHFVENLDDRLRDNIVAMVNFDMVGRSQGGEVIVAGVGTASQWPELLQAHGAGLNVKTNPDGYGPSDHGSFYEAGIPVLHFFTGPHEDYHKPSDDIDKLDFETMTKITAMALGIVEQVVAESVEFDFAQTKRKAPAGGRRFRVSLGTIPDYAGGVDGVRLSGVRKGGPAATAGLQKGDIIQRMGEREIHNLDDYMAAFGELQPGAEIPVIVDRGGERVELQLTPAAPKNH